MSKRNKQSGPGTPPPATPTSQDDEAQPTLSLCMMVKDEEKNLPRALDSAAPWVDEIIVVDTGSTDRTIEIAESYGAKIYHHPWEDDFAKHRNQTLSYATCDWMFILDADEELDQQSAPLIRQAIKDPKYDAFLIELANESKSGGATFVLHARLFRNHCGFHYEGKVHNRPIIKGPATKLPVKLFHYGYALDDETMEAKHQRRVEMIRKWVAQEPDNYLSHSYLAQTLASAKETEVEAVDEALIAIDLLQGHVDGVEQLPRAYYPLLMSLAGLGRDQEVLEHSRKCLEAVPFYPDPHFFLTFAHYRRQQWTEVIDQAKLFIKSQEYAAEHPEKFIYVENMTRDQVRWVYMRWIISAVHLDRADEAYRILDRLLAENNHETVVKMVLQDLLSQGHLVEARTAWQKTRDARPDWDWHTEYEAALLAKETRDAPQGLAEEARAALAADDFALAVEKFGQGVAAAPTDRQALLGLAKSLDGQGRSQEAAAQYMAGLCGGSGHAWAWQRLAEIYAADGDHRNAAVLLQRLAAMAPPEAQAGVSAALAEAQGMVPPDPLGTVAEHPPRLLVFLAPGLSPDMVQTAAPHLLMHRAWGTLAEGPGQDGSSAPAWATLYCGATPDIHGIVDDPPPGQAPSLSDLKTPSVWEVMAKELRVGLAAIPLGCPPPRINGWALAGYPGGLLKPEMVHPPELAPLALASGYRPDFVAGPEEEQSYCFLMERDYSQEAGLYQLERNRISTAMAMPAVDVLALGLYTVERVQNCFGMEPSNFRTGAYQQIYSCIESLVAALHPQAFALISQRACSSQAAGHQPGGFYCLSWLKGEGGKARAEDIAPELLKAVGLNPDGLGRPR